MSLLIPESISLHDRPSDPELSLAHKLLVVMCGSTATNRASKNYFQFTCVGITCSDCNLRIFDGLGNLISNEEAADRLELVLMSM